MFHLVNDIITCDVVMDIPASAWILFDGCSTDISNKMTFRNEDRENKLGCHTSKEFGKQTFPCSNQLYDV